MRISDLILYNDHQLVALCKPGGMPAQEDRSGDPSLHRLAQAYCKRDLYLVNRIDRPCSGLVLCAKTPVSAAHLNTQWQAHLISKTYLAIIGKGISPPHGTLEHALLKRGNKSLIAGDSDAGQATEVHLAYRIKAELDTYDILEVKTHTGYFHQIRAQLAAAGFPIKGDVKYGARRANKDKTICLHCTEITFEHPGTQGTMTLQCPLPDNDIWGAAGLIPGVSPVTAIE